MFSGVVVTVDGETAVAGQRDDVRCDRVSLLWYAPTACVTALPITVTPPRRHVRGGRRARPMPPRDITGRRRRLRVKSVARGRRRARHDDGRNVRSRGGVSTSTPLSLRTRLCRQRARDRHVRLVVTSASCLQLSPVRFTALGTAA